MKAKLGLLPVVLAGVGALVLVSTAPIIAINFMTSRTVFTELVGRIVERGIDGLELALRNHLDAAMHQADFIVENIQSAQLELPYVVRQAGSLLMWFSAISNAERA